MSSFRPAQRKNAKLRLALSGTAGAGKTYSALLMAKEFGKKIAVLDSERGSASLYSDLVPFSVCELEEKNPAEYLKKITEAAAEGFDVLVIDSYSHSWIGALEAIDKMGGWVRGGKTVSPLVQKLVDAVLSYPGHVIATMRSKADFAIETVDGKAKMKKLGMATVAREGTDFEFSVMLEITTDGAVTVSKTRCPALTGGLYSREDVTKIARTLKTWLESGAALSPVDAMKERIRFADSDSRLAALLSEIKAMSQEERAELAAPYKSRKAELESEAALDE
jgi:AAA domain